MYTQRFFDNHLLTLLIDTLNFLVSGDSQIIPQYASKLNG